MNDTISIVGTPTDDTTVVNPTGTGTGTFRSGDSPDFNFTGFIGLTVSGGTGGTDSVEIDGSNANNVVTTPAANTIQVDTGTVAMTGTFASLLLQTGGGNDSITLNQNLSMPGTLRTINGGDGNDSLTLVDNVGQADFPQQIEYYGGNGNNSLTFTGTLVATSTNYAVGDRGRGGRPAHLCGGTQTVTFTGLAPDHG